MKIGEFAQKSGIHITTIRYYIKRGLLVPQKTEGDAQFVFFEKDLENIQLITKLKNMGFSIEEAHRVLSMQRVSNYTDPEYIDDYIDLMLNKKVALRNDIKTIEQQLHNLDLEIEKTGTARGLSQTRIGLPIEAMSWLECPKCHLPFSYHNIEIHNQYIMQGKAQCACGYCADIIDGVLYTRDQQISKYDKPDTKRKLYRTMPNCLVTKLQESANWVSQKFSEVQPRSVFMETHLNSFFFLYKYLRELDASCYFVLCDKFKEIILMNKEYIERLGVQPNILFIVNNDNEFPLKNGLVDYFIDYSSTNENYIFSSEFLLNQVFRYMKPTGKILSTWFSFEKKSKSLDNLRKSYPENHPLNYTQDLFLMQYPQNYQLIERKDLGFIQDSGEDITFIFHEKNEKLFFTCFELKPKK